MFSRRNGIGHWYFSDCILGVGLNLINSINDRILDVGLNPIIKVRKMFACSHTLSYRPRYTEYVTTWAFCCSFSYHDGVLFKRRSNLYSVITTFKHREESDLEARQARQAQNIKNQNKNKLVLGLLSVILDTTCLLYSCACFYWLWLIFWENTYTILLENLEEYLGDTFF